MMIAPNLHEGLQENAHDGPRDCTAAIIYGSCITIWREGRLLARNTKADRSERQTRLANTKRSRLISLPSSGVGMSLLSVFVLEPETGQDTAAVRAHRRLRAELSDPHLLTEAAARIGVLFPHLDCIVGDDSIEIRLPPEESNEMLQTLSDLILRVQISNRDAPLRARLYARLLG